MSARVKVKICGLIDPAAAESAVEAGANYLGAVFFPPSPRAVSPADAAEMFEFVPARVKRVGLFVDPTDQMLADTLNHVRLDYFQLHGSETPERVEQIRLEFGLPVIKALGIAAEPDLTAAKAYDGIADLLMFDAKPAAGTDRPGGHGIAFDWRLLKGRKWKSPWFLAGGLTADNVTEAILLSGAKLVDVASGVESAPGVKDADKVARFVTAAKGPN